jgi:hypothetical protein
LNEILFSIGSRFFQMAGSAAAPPITPVGMTRKNRKDDDGERRRVSRCIRTVRAVFKVCRRQCVPLCSSKFSRRDFIQWHEEAAEGMRTKTRRFLKLTIGAELRHQPVASVSVRRGPRNDT